MSFAPLLVIGALLVVMLFLSNRTKTKKVAADAERRQKMVAGTAVMTTSGLHGTITAIDPANDGSPADAVTLRIAPGVEVRWALAAVREAPERVVAAPVDATSDLEVTDPTAGPVTGGPVRLVKPKGRAAER